MKKLCRILTLGIGLYLVLLLFFYWQQNIFIYHPTRSATQLALPYKTIHLVTTDKMSLSAWYKPAAANKPTLLILHGNAGLASDRADIAAPYLQLGWGALLLEYRGYGLNPGKPSENGLTQDANAGWNFLKEQGISAQCIILYGESLGSAIAVNLAVQHPDAAALILQAPFNRLAAVGQTHYPYLPVNLLLRDKFDSESKIQGLTMPIIIVHGTKDTLVPITLSKKLFHAAHQPKFMLIYPQTHHTDWNYTQLSEDLLPILVSLNLTLCPREV